MSTELALRGLLFVGELFLAGFLTMALAMEAASISKRASLRHLVWITAFGALLLLPALAALVPSQIQLALLPAPAPVSAMQVVDVPRVATAPDTAWHFDLTTITYALAAIWILGVALIALRGLFAAIGLQRLRRNSVPHDASGLTLPDAGRGYEIRVASAPNDCGPVTWGILRPVVLLPWSSMFWTRERMQAVLLHEVAHISRRDSLTQFLARIACALYWPNPLVWMGAHAMRGEAEMAADDAVLVSGIRPSSYAGELLQLASEFRVRQTALAGVPLFMAQPSALETRVASVLAPTSTRSGVTAMDVVKITAVGILALGALAFARPSLAQDAPAPVTEAQLPDVPPPPPEPAAAPIAPPAPSAALAEPATPPVSASPVTPETHVIEVKPGHHREVIVHTDVRDADGHPARHIRVIIDGKPYNTEAEIARVQPEIGRAMAEVKANEKTIKIIQEERPKMMAKFDKAMRDARPEIDRAIEEARAELAKAHMDVNIQESVDSALKRVEVRIEAREHGKRSGHEVEIERSEQDEDSDTPGTK
jgi:beta-lactamase regulating signal transducer with metallopeptidase domain